MTFASSQDEGDIELAWEHVHARPALKAILAQYGLDPVDAKMLVSTLGWVVLWKLRLSKSSLSPNSGLLCDYSSGNIFNNVQGCCMMSLLLSISSFSLPLHQHCCCKWHNTAVRLPLLEVVLWREA